MRNLYQTNNEQLRHCCNLVWDGIEEFESFNIFVVPRLEYNDRVDSLVVLAMLLIPHKDSMVLPTPLSYFFI